MSNPDCLFCKIIKKEIPAFIIFENEKIIVFKDINQVAPTHFLIVPKVHIENVNEIEDEHKDVLAEIFFTAKKLATTHELKEDSYRLVVNTNQLSGQTVFHIHCHFLANRSFMWPPG